MIFYAKFLVLFSRFRVFVLWPAAVLYLLTELIRYQDFTWVLAGILIFYPLHQLSYSIGGHKLFAHRTFTPNSWYPYLTTILLSICFYGSPIMLSIIHREHHRYADTDQDPHSPTKGRWHAFLGWAWNYTPPPPSANIGGDLVRDFPFLKSYEKIEWLVFPIFFGTLALISKWLFLAFLLAAVLSFTLGMLLVNTFSHDPASPDQNKAIDQPRMARWINPTFMHKQHHNDSSLYDYSVPGVTDYSAAFIRRFLMKKS